MTPHLFSILKSRWRSLTSVHCRNCQDNGYTRTYYNHSPRCIWYGKHHVSSFCKKPNNVPPTCALRKGSHYIIYRNCQIHKDLQKTRKLILKPSPWLDKPSFTISWSTENYSVISSTQTQSRTCYFQVTSVAKQNPSALPSTQSTDICLLLNNFID